MLAVIVGRNEATVVLVAIPVSLAVISPVAGATIVAGAGPTHCGRPTETPTTAMPNIAPPPTTAESTLRRACGFISSGLPGMVRSNPRAECF